MPLHACMAVRTDNDISICIILRDMLEAVKPEAILHVTDRNEKTRFLAQPVFYGVEKLIDAYIHRR